ncbi:MAG: transposase, partial [Gammaproteobacteria bacterium]|nr:transposase [Gammaproteobacteria bacterium]
MPWQEAITVKLREEFVLKALEPYSNVSELCRAYGISRKTGYKWIKRFREGGIEGLADRSRRPHTSPLRASGEVVLRVIELRRRHKTWGPKKLRVVLLRSIPQRDAPSVRTIARILKRAGLVRPIGRPRGRNVSMAPTERPEVVATSPNELWTVDFKGWWRTRDGKRAEPLTVRDAHSRYVICAKLLESTKAHPVQSVFKGLFEHYGLPKAILVDNGAPFVSMHSRAGLTSLSAWWVALGIQMVRGRPGHPQDNGGHERMHLDLRFEVEDIAADNLEMQREVLEDWRQRFNHV